MISKRQELELVPLRVSYWATRAPQVCGEVTGKVDRGIGRSDSLSAVWSLQLVDDLRFKSQLEKVVTGD